MENRKGLLGFDHWRQGWRLFDWEDVHLLGEDGDARWKA